MTQGLGFRVEFCRVGTGFNISKHRDSPQKNVLPKNPIKLFLHTLRTGILFAEARIKSCCSGDVGWLA